jgi:protein phosphatase
MTALRSGSATDVGRRRQINQDKILESDTIFAVADGMGGHQGGEVASLEAIEALRDAFHRDPTAAGLEAAVRRANEAVAQRARASSELRNMGTTLTVVALVDGEAGDDLLVVANIGDSRAYLLRDGELSQLTEDHSVPEELLRQGQLTRDEADIDPRRHILTRVLGASYGEGPDLQNLIPYAGDRLLLCSDGLYNEVDDDAIAHVLRTVADPADAARQLVEEANRNGGADNISVVVVDVVDDDGRARAASATLGAEVPDPARSPVTTRRASNLMSADERNEQLRRLARDGDGDRSADSATSWSGDAEPDEHDVPSRRVTGRVVVFLVVVVLVLVAAVAAIGFYARGSYYVGLAEGQVTIFKGRPGGLLWFKPTVAERTDLTQAAVPPSRVDDVEQGHTVATLDEARRYVTNLEATPGAGTATTTTAPAAPPTTAPGTTTP